MSQPRTASPAVSLNTAGWILAVAALLALFFNPGEADLELLGRILLGAAAVCWILQVSRRGQ